MPQCGGQGGRPGDRKGRSVFLVPTSCGQALGSCGTGHLGEVVDDRQGQCLLRREVKIHGPLGGADDPVDGAELLDSNEVFAGRYLAFPSRHTCQCCVCGFYTPGCLMRSTSPHAWCWTHRSPAQARRGAGSRRGGRRRHQCGPRREITPGGDGRGIQRGQQHVSKYRAPVTAILGGWSTLCASRRVRCTEAAG